MIIWSGRGILLVVVLLATLFLCVSILPEDISDYGFVLSGYLTGFFGWYFGKKWNTKDGQFLIDKKTGKGLKVRNSHTLFWIPMQHWGIIFSILGTIVLFQNSVILGGIALLFIITITTLSLVNKGQNNKGAGKTLKKEKKESVKPKIASTNNSSEIISEFKKKKSVMKEFEPSNHSRFFPKQ